MLNYVFSFIIILSIIYSLFTGDFPKITEGALESSQQTIELTFTILCSMCLFNGVIRVFEEAGVLKRLARILKKPLKFLYKDVKDEKVFGIMSMNIGANLLGMGNAATPFGIKTMQGLKGNNEKATNSMCLFAIMNTASIQIIPSTILAIRLKYGSSSPFSIIIPIWICSVTGLITGILLCKIFERRG